ncbi:MAG: hypothetical protein HUJ74_00605 [Lachnospiraceae bacterium]|nr:hypothetical protein [Lachnospiraceae bacterium]
MKKTAEDLSHYIEKTDVMEGMKAGRVRHDRPLFSDIGKEQNLLLRAAIE